MPASFTRAASVRHFNRNHPACQGAFAGLVFSGDREALGDLPGEITADTSWKFGLIDPRLPTERDFAHSADFGLRLWPHHRVAPIPGICFILSDFDHPAIGRLVQLGAVEGEHFVTLDSLGAGAEESIRFTRLAALSEQLGTSDRILLLGFGDQGAWFAEQLRTNFGMSSDQIVVVDSGEQSRLRASASGHEVLDDVPADLHRYAAVIHTPLMRYESLHGILQQARRLGLRALDNAATSIGVPQFRARGAVRLEPAADRALLVRGARISPQPHGLAIEANVMREETRSLAGVVFPVLQGIQRIDWMSSEAPIDLAEPWAFETLAAQPGGRLRRAWVSVRRRHAMPVFAAREFAMDLWPRAAQEVFPSVCASDLGATRFERLLKRHIDQQEIVMPAQTSAQQAVLGIIAKHYADDAPLVEIGSALGGSAMLMAAATDERRPPFISIDPQTASRPIMRFAFEQIEQLKRLQQIMETSDKAIASLQHLRGQAGLVFIDGLHSEAGCASDFINYAPLVRPGGALLIHDCDMARFSVLRVLVEQVLTDPRFEMKCMVDGLAVLERRS